MNRDHLLRNWRIFALRSGLESCDGLVEEEREPLVLCDLQSSFLEVLLEVIDVPGQNKQARLKRHRHYCPRILSFSGWNVSDSNNPVESIERCRRVWH